MRKQTREKLADSIRLWHESRRVMMEYCRIVGEAIAEHGEYGPLISGVVQLHFPPEVKERLRSTLTEAHKLRDAGFAARPKRIRHTTMQEAYAEVRAEYPNTYYL